MALFRRMFGKVSTVANCRFLSNAEVISKEKKYTANTYDSVPVVINRAEGVYVWDVEGKRYYDMLSGYSSLALGHSPADVLEALRDQAGRVHHVSRAFHSEMLAEYAEYLCNMMGYDKMIPMNTGVEAVDTAVKLARRWGYRVKKIQEGRVKILMAKNNFWGRSLAAVSTSNDPAGKDHFGPYLPGFQIIPYDDLDALEEALADPEVAAYVMEPIQGEGGVVVPKEGYLKGVRNLCDKYNILWVVDEVQTGLYRTARKLCVNHEQVKPDVVTLGKALSAGMFPVSAVLASNDIMLLMGPGSHGSTYGGCPLGAKVALTALKSLIQLDTDHLTALGDKIRDRARNLPEKVVSGVQGKGMLNAIKIRTDVISTHDLSHKIAEGGALCKEGKGGVLRISPPLIITMEQIDEVMDIIHDACEHV